MKKYSDPQFRATLRGGKIERYTKEMSRGNEQKRDVDRAKVYSQMYVSSSPRVESSVCDEQRSSAFVSVPTLLPNFKLEERSSALRAFEN